MAEQFNPDLLRVSLKEYTKSARRFVCKVTPELSESQSVNYKTFDPVHAPGSILSYVNTPSRTFQLSSVKLLSRTKQEADYTLEKLYLLRSWTKPVFGKTTTADDILGAPPTVLLLSAYTNNSSTNEANKIKQNIKNVPVVITSLNITYPSDVDYIPSSEGTPTPIIMSIDISLTETHAPTEYAKFNIADYRDGKMVRF